MFAPVIENMTEQRAEIVNNKVNNKGTKITALTPHWYLYC